MSKQGLRACAALAVLSLFSVSCASAPEPLSAPAPEARFETNAHGVVVRPTEAAPVRLTVMSDEIIRVTKARGGDFDAGPGSLMVVAEPAEGGFQVAQEGALVVLTTPKLRAEVSLATGEVLFKDASGAVALDEAGAGEITPADVRGETYFAVRQDFEAGTDEGYYGLGQHQNRQFNYAGQDVVLEQHNIVDVVPFLTSSRNYGILWDNNGVTRFGDPRAYQPINAALKVYDEAGAEGGLTGRYYRGDEIVLTRTEADPNFQFLPADQFLREGAPRGAWPEAFGNVSPTRITWDGKIEAEVSGTHKFRLYASNYFKLWIDGELVMDRWRQNWNPWHHTFDLQMEAGERHDIRIEWLPNDGYLRLLHLDPRAAGERDEMTLSSTTAHAIDYYFIHGDSMDEVIAGYRALTGPAIMLPRWAYGFWQSRQRYTNQQELLDVVRGYRRRGIPLDNIVLDWFYWPEDKWGSHEFDAARFPDPRGMVEAVHAQNAQIMISVWPKFYPSTANYAELEAGGHVYKRQIEMASRDWVGPGYPNTFYDPYTPEGRAIYWRQIRERLDGLGFDAWWTDATEPDSHSNVSIEERALRMGPTAWGPGEAVFNSFVIPHSRAFFEGEQGVDPNDRVFLLTRSTFGGLQRYGAASWSGDVAARWEDLAEQIPAGLNLALSGLPNWTHDIGGFAVEDRYTRQEPAHLDEWRELNLRWFQFGAFSPLFRSHGEFPYREIFNIAPRGSVVYDSMVWHDRLRYRLLPYIYTAAADTYHRSGTIMRPLVMDFAADPNVADIGDEYMFGPAFLVAPVTEYRARSWNVYLPAGADWYDFHTGARHTGGQTLDADAPLSRMPLFVKAGSIVPTGPAIQYSDQNLSGPITILVYTGADGSFDLYEDDGETYAHQNGAFSRIPLRYDEASGTLTIGAREGSFEGMATQRQFKVRWMSGPSRNAANLDARADAQASYSGAEVRITRGR